MRIHFLPFFLGVPLGLFPPIACAIDLVSSYPDGSQTITMGSSDPSVSADGRYVAFVSGERFLPVGGYETDNIYLKDRVKGEVTLVSVTTDGNTGSRDSYAPQISANGNFVIFQSGAPDLIDDDTNGAVDVFVRDLVNETTIRISVDKDGRELVGASFEGSISGNGKIVAFTSLDPTLHPDDENEAGDVFVRNLDDPASLRLASKGLGGETGDGYSRFPFVCESGEYVAFRSDADDLVEGDTGNTDVFRYRVDDDVVDWVSVSSEGESADDSSFSVSLSADGAVAVFGSSATDLISDGPTGTQRKVFAREMDSDGRGETTLVSINSSIEAANDDSSVGTPGISSDGRFAIFKSKATNLGGPAPVGANENLYRHDRSTKETTSVVVTVDGTGLDSSVPSLAISGNGETIVFSTNSENILSEDLNGGIEDIFAFPDLPQPVLVRDQTFAQSALLKKLRKLKKKMKAAKRKKQVAKVKRFKKKIKKLTKQLRSL